VNDAGHVSGLDICPQPHSATSPKLQKGEKEDYGGFVGGSIRP